MTLGTLLAEFGDLASDPSRPYKVPQQGTSPIADACCGSFNLTSHELPRSP